MNYLFVIARGCYGERPELVLIVTILSVAVPLAASVAFGRRIR